MLSDNSFLLLFFVTTYLEREEGVKLLLGWDPYN